MCIRDIRVRFQGRLCCSCQGTRYRVLAIGTCCSLFIDPFTPHSPHAHHQSPISNLQSPISTPLSPLHSPRTISLLLYFSVFCFYASLLLYFSASLLLCFSTRLHLQSPISNLQSSISNLLSPKSNIQSLLLRPQDLQKCVEGVKIHAHSWIFNQGAIG